MTTDLPPAVATRHLTRASPPHPEIPLALYPVGTAEDLDRESPVPLYRQIARLIERAIDRGDLGAGERIENEVELAQQLAVSRPTVRRAIAVLVASGTIIRRRGVGTSVAHRTISLTLSDDDIVECLSRDGEDPHFTVLEVKIEPVRPAVGAALGVSAGSAVLHLRRLVRVDGAAIGLIDGYATPLLASITDPQLATTGMRTLVHERLAPIAGLNHLLDAVSAETIPARLLDRPVSAPLLRIRTTGLDAEQDPLYYAEQYFRGDLARVVAPART